MATPSFPMIEGLLQSLATVTYSDAKEGQKALARVYQQGRFW